MGWLYLRSLGGHPGPRQYLDAQFTHRDFDLASRVLRSALVGVRVYYAAVEEVSPTGREVYGLVCLVRYNRRDKEGYIFGYKDMDEAMGPNASDCPEAILDLLTPTNQPNAIAWRARCRANAAARRRVCAKPTPLPGQMIVFDTPLRFADGRSHERLQAVANPRGGRTVLFRDPDRGGLYRIPNLKARDYRLVDPPPA